MLYDDNEWRDKYNVVWKDGIAQQRTIMAKWLESVMLEAKEAYYETDKPIMSDQMYDEFEHRLKINDPKSKILEKVGS